MSLHRLTVHRYIDWADHVWLAVTGHPVPATLARWDHGELVEILTLSVDTANSGLLSITQTKWKYLKSFSPGGSYQISNVRPVNSEYEGLRWQCYVVSYSDRFTMWHDDGYGSVGYLWSSWAVSVLVVTVCTLSRSLRAVISQLSPLALSTSPPQHQHNLSFPSRYLHQQCSHSYE